MTSDLESFVDAEQYQGNKSVVIENDYVFPISHVDSIIIKTPIGDLKLSNTLFS